MRPVMFDIGDFGFYFFFINFEKFRQIFFYPLYFFKIGQSLFDKRNAYPF